MRLFWETGAFHESRRVYPQGVRPRSVSEEMKVKSDPLRSVILQVTSKPTGGGVVLCERKEEVSRLGQELDVLIKKSGSIVNKRKY